ncbi:hypothetical protein AB0C21_20865 [Spirillospora sp. NPDC049024]
MSGVRHRLTGRITVPLPPAEAFPLFTARGERRWVPGWEGAAQLHRFADGYPAFLATWQDAITDALQAEALQADAVRAANPGPAT